MEDSFQLLEDRIGRAAKRLKELQAETGSLRGALAEAQSRAEEAEKRLEETVAAGGDGDDASAEMEKLTREVQGLRAERKEIRKRLGRLVELLEGLE